MIKVVIADDHRLFGEGIKSLFAQTGDYEVVAMAEDGRQAVELARRHKPDIVIMDIAMPGQNGIDATRSIGESCPDTRVVALSMHAERSFVLETLKAGAAAYLLKDEAFETLLDALAMVLDGGTYLPPRVSSLLLQDLLDEDEGQALTSREIEVLKLLSQGKSTKQIAKRLCVSVKTAESHRSNIMKKLNFKNLADLTRYAVRKGLVKL